VIIYPFLEDLLNLCEFFIGWLQSELNGVVSNEVFAFANNLQDN